MGVVARTGRRRSIAAGFMVVWLTVWTSAILVAVWQTGSLALAGEPGAVLFLVAWTIAAGFALRSGVLRLKALLLGEASSPRTAGRHRWRDGMNDPAP